MTIFYSATDPRGITVFVAEDRWRHAVEQHPELEGEIEAVALTVTAPEVILTNPQNSPNLPQRSAQERYVRFDGALNTNLVVVAKTVPAGGRVPGVGVVTTACRELWTAHSTYYRPKGTQLWPPLTVL